MLLHPFLLQAYPGQISQVSSTFALRLLNEWIHLLSFPIWEPLLIQPVACRYTDMESEDYHFYQGLVYLLENDVSTLGYDLTFSTEVTPC